MNFDRPSFFQQKVDSSYTSLAQPGLNDGQPQRSPSFVSNEERIELHRYPSQSSQARLLSRTSKTDITSLFSQRTGSTSSRIPAKSGTGLWHNQMLVDRSLRSMALTTALFAVIMLIITFVWLPDFVKMGNKDKSTSVLAAGETCRSSATKILWIHLFVNIAATMILGMSNTYQTLVTALDIGEIQQMLQKEGDCKIGTNSPWSINRKSKGKLVAWLSWVLLVATSIPIHLLANSFVGMSYTVSGTTVDYKATALQLSNTTTEYGSAARDFLCWSAFRTGSSWMQDYREAPGISLYDTNFYNSRGYSSLMVQSYSGTYSAILVEYDEKGCGALRESATSMDELITGFNTTSGDCVNGVNVNCNYDVSDPSKSDNILKCSISVRMQAAITLAISLGLKAAYMVAWCLRMRGRQKSKLLTFGDALAASAFNPDVHVRNECLVNATEAYRQSNQHRCHKHCKSTEASATGDELGHCQKCKKFNEADKQSGLEHPIVATKFKKSLISNLGGNAVVQMILMSGCSMAMLGVSLMAAVLSGSSQTSFLDTCRQDATTPKTGYFNKTEYDECASHAGEHWRKTSGEWGGYNESVPIASLESNSIGSESASFVIANGAQLIYSLLYLLVIYNITLISMEHDWGSFESARKKVRCTLFKGKGFSQSYLMQLPKRIIFPIMGFSALMHWLLGQAIATKEWIYTSDGAPQVGIPDFEIVQYQVVYAAYPLWLSTICMIAMTAVCWWAFTYSREGYMPQMYGSIRVICASVTSLDTFPAEGVQWGDLGEGKRFRHAGFSDSDVGTVVPGELYCGTAPRKRTEQEREKMD